MALTRFKPPGRGPSAPPHRAGLHHVLYVEDEDANWEVAQLALRDKLHLERARDAEQAFALLARRHFDVILMDIQLSGSALNGIDITRILKGTYPGNVPTFAAGIHCDATPVVFVTAYTARYKKEQLLAVGGDDMISKPVDFVRLSLVISRLLVRGAMGTPSH